MTYKREGFSSVTPYIIVNDAQKVLDFAKRAFDAEELLVQRREDGSIQHAELQIDDGIIMLGSSSSGESMPTAIHLYVADCDCHYERGLASGGTSVSEPSDHFYGDRNAGVKDPCGNVWWVATHKEALSRETIQERAKKAS